MKLEVNSLLRSYLYTTFINVEYAKSYTPNVSMVVTVKQAGLLAIHIYFKLCKFAFEQPNSLLLLTLLVGAIFSREDIRDMVTKLAVDPLVVLAATNASCQSGGQFLDESSINKAVVAIIVASANIKDKDVTHGIAGKTIRQYLGQKKKFDDTKFAITYVC